jgi:hypothetical protein
MRRTLIALLFLGAAADLFAQAYYSGDGGRGIRIAVTAPVGQNLSKEEEYLPVLVQNWLTGGFNRFSAMTVIDRQNQEAVLGEQKISAAGGSEDDYIRIGNLTNAKYVVAGTIIRLGASQFSLQLAVTDTETGVRHPGASFMKNCSPGQLRSAQAINEACAELLARLGVRLTEAGKKELLGGGAASLEAETSLARGITAQIKGGTIEALSWYYQAAAFDPSLAEAASRISTLSTVVSGDGFGQNIRGDIEARREWLGILKECAAFYRDHLPFEIGYDSNLESGAVDYASETVTLSCLIRISPSEAGFRPLNDLLAGLGKTGRQGVWGFEGWPFSVKPADPAALVFGGNRNLGFTVNAVLLTGTGKTAGSASASLSVTLPAPSGGRIALPRPVSGTIAFRGVKAGDITDVMTVRIAGINGISAEAAAEGGYVRVVDLRPELNRRQVFFEARGIRDNEMVITGYTGGGGDVVIPETFDHLPVTAIGDRAFYSKKLSSVVIPGNVNTIGKEAFAGNRLTAVAIPEGVTAIGENAFAGNQLNSITIPTSVTVIGKEAFYSNKLSSLTIPGSVKTIGVSAFCNNKLSSLTISEGVTAIENGAFNVNELRSVTIPGSVKTIEGGAFSNNRRLERITIGQGVNVHSINNDVSRYSYDRFPGAYNQNGKRAGTYRYGYTGPSRQSRIKLRVKTT